jgi:hypothetical protein
MDLPDLKAAREDAIRFCGEMLNHTTRLGELLKKKKEASRSSAQSGPSRQPL